MFNTALTTFVCVADNGSFNKAAEKLYISSTAVIKQMNLLEAHLGLQLFYRSGRGVSLTPAGQSVYKDAKFLFSFSAQAIARAQAQMDAEKMVFRVPTSLLNPCKPFMELWNQVNDRFPQCKIQIVPFEDNHESILSVIEQLGDRFDFITGVCDSKKWLSKCSFLPLGTYKKCVSMSANHRLAKRKRLKISDLYGETLIMVKPGDSPANDRMSGSQNWYGCWKNAEINAFPFSGYPFRLQFAASMAMINKRPVSSWAGFSKLIT